MHFTDNAGLFAGSEVLHHSGQHIRRIVMSVAPDLAICLDSGSKLRPAPFPIGWKVDEVLHFGRMGEDADMLVKPLRECSEVHLQRSLGTLESYILFHIAGESSTTVVAFYLYKLCGIAKQ